LDGNSVYELDGRPIQLMNNASSEERQYFTDHFVTTNERHSIEPYNKRMAREWENIHGTSHHARYPRPNYPPSTLLGSIHSSDPSYQIGEAESRR
jgi:hypothetical protein